MTAEMLTAKEAAREVDRTVRTIMRWQEQGLIRFHERHDHRGRVRLTSRERLLRVDADQRSKKGGRPPREQGAMEGSAP